MMNLKTFDTMETMDYNDADLVSQSLAGSREAFGRIVARYQSLICALSYSATGDLKQSEDLAQETFITAWKELAKLREPAKLRPWLCRISRNHTCDALRKQGRDPGHQAEHLDAAHEEPAAEPPPLEQAISNEEQAILWRSLEQIPETYREPLVLFYREHQSIETVAANLDLTEEAVKQRLSRGRKLLHEQVLAFVEGALEKTTPGQRFTLNVMDALPGATASAKAATFGAAAVKGGIGVKAGGAMGLLATICSPLLIVFGTYNSYRMSIDEARTDEERSNVKAIFVNALIYSLVATIVLALPAYLLCQKQNEMSAFPYLLINSAIIIYFLSIFGMYFTSLPARRRYLAQQLAAKHDGHYPPAAYEYRSKMQLLGMPLLHVRTGDRFDVVRPPVKAWIAIGGSNAVGMIFASGGTAVAPIAFGGIAVGFLSFGAVSTGLIALGALSVGIGSYGGVAVGWLAFGAIALGCKAAMGCGAVAFAYAAGNIAHAAQANNDAARQFFGQSTFFQITQHFFKHGVLILLVWIVPSAWQARVVARARARQPGENY